jgi:hypothetical protein
MGMRARRVDDNQAAIVAALRKAGAVVWITSQLGNGGPDLVVARGTNVALIEIKDPSKPRLDRQLTPKEQEFHARWPGRIGVAETFEQAWALLADPEQFVMFEATA